jgi:hypothetical protein
MNIENNGLAVAHGDFFRKVLILWWFIVMNGRSFSSCGSCTVLHGEDVVRGTCLLLAHRTPAQGREINGEPIGEYERSDNEVSWSGSEESADRRQLRFYQQC